MKDLIRRDHADTCDILTDDPVSTSLGPRVGAEGRPLMTPREILAWPRAAENFMNRMTTSPRKVHDRRVGVRSTGIGLVVLALVGCAVRPTTPETIQPTITAIEALGYRCGDGIKDNVPSGLNQWSCDGTIDSVRTTVLVDGNAEGVAGVALFAEDPRNPAVTARQFVRLLDAVPPLNTAPALKDTVAGWAGGEQAWTVGGIRISADCDAGQCRFIVMPAGHALRPLPLP